jgi:type III pantothenate kinase
LSYFYPVLLHGDFMNNYIIAADIGNTNTHVGLINCASRSILSLDIFPSGEINNRLIESIASLSQSMKHAAPVPVVVSSVLSPIEKQFSDSLSDAVDGKVSWVKYDPKLPVKVHYQDPLRLGADRLVNCVYGFYSAKKRDLIIIDAGTAIKVDYVNAGGEFMGGVILPGLTMQLQSLHDKTSLLPLVDPGEVGIEFPGLTTESCILGGVRLGIAGALSFLVEKYRIQFNKDAAVLTTGGSWKYVQEYVRFTFEYIPELTLVGCALYEQSLSL